MKFNFYATVITTGGLLNILAHSNNDGSVHAELADEFGPWKKAFIDPTEFRAWFRQLHIKNVLRKAESYS
ncbi:hypothetical protein ABES02_29625 [Neobacillus pocheonensis]|uniref:hypothetical protein n=1 Tax=Neobacillus pocheonensis TaxID=363869 RepID=UPI003D2734D4